MLPQIAEIKQNPQKKLSGETAESSPERVGKLAADFNKYKLQQT